MSSVDIVVPNYNYGRFLPDCISSIWGQGFDDYRILIVDNASTDDSVEVARTLAARDPRIELRLHKQNMGVHASINAGVDWARSDYLIVLCADDMLAPGCLKRATGILDANPHVTLALGRYQIVDAAPAEPRQMPVEPWNIVSGSAFIESFCRRIRRTVAPVVRTSAQKKIGHYRSEVFHNDDLEILIRLATVGDIAVTDAVTSIQRWHGANLGSAITSDASEKWRQEEAIFLSFFRHEGASLGNREALQALARRNIGMRAYWSALAQLLRGDTAKFVSVMKFALSRSPWSMLVPPVSALSRIDAPVNRLREIVRDRRARRAQ